MSTWRRGLAARLLDVCSYDEAGNQALDAAVEAARALPSDGWIGRIAEGAPSQVVVDPQVIESYLGRRAKTA